VETEAEEDVRPGKAAVALPDENAVLPLKCIMEVDVNGTGAT